MEDIFSKYNIIYVNNKRYYKVDLNNLDTNFEFSTPLYLKIKEHLIEERSYVELIYKEALYLNFLSFKSDEELLNIKNFWGKQDVFSLNQKSNYRKFNDSIYINLNHTGIHSIWTIKLLLDEWNINVNEVELVIRRLPKGEPKEVSEYFKNETITKFKEYLILIKDYSDKKIEVVFKLLNYLNDRICPIAFKNCGNNNLYVFLEYYSFFKVKSDLIEYLEFNFPNKLDVIKKYKFALELLDSFYKIYLPK